MTDRCPYYLAVLPAVLPQRSLDVLATGAPDSVAVIDAGSSLSVTYDELRKRVDTRRTELGLHTRSLVVIAVSNTLSFVVDYLAVLSDGHVPLLAGDHADRLADAWNAAALIRTGFDGSMIEHRTARPIDLHPDLALLLSTSGSTGSPKLVRLSHRNVLSNATAIGAYLGLSDADRAISSLPMHYCYGLSVLHSHLVAGGSIVLTDASVVDPCFAAALREHRVTNLAGVPHTFELLDRVGPDVLRSGSLRFVTQAGGRMSPERVGTWLERGEAWGFDVYVMYGQTEATARMAYLPPDIARRRPDAIGVPIPGGEIEVRPVEDGPDGVGELVYRGPNVMLGYAVTERDLALGPTLEELRTGDLGRFDPVEGVFEIVGRRSRFIKPFGLRIDLDAVEWTLAAAGVSSAVTGDDHRLIVCAPGADQATLRDDVVALTGLSGGAVVVDTGEVPLTPSGKVDYAVILGRVRGDAETPVADVGATVAGVYEAVLGRDDVSPASTFVSLGGDSLSYVECSLQLERVLGPLPADWHLTAVADLESITPRRRPSVDTTVLLRALGICAIVSTHMQLMWFPGGSHLLLAVAGYNLARFQLPIEHWRDRVRAGLRTAARVATPAVLWTGVCMLLVGGYSWATLLLVNNNLAPRTHESGRWHYWFTEVFVQLTLAATLLVAIPVVRRWERRLSYVFPLVLFVVLLVFRYRWIELGPYANLRFRTQGVAWFFVMGWLAHQSSSTTKRILTSVLCWYTVDGFFLGTDRETFIALAIVGFVWIKAVPLPRPAITVVATIAAASMWIYISHFRIFPPLQRALPDGVAYVSTILAGVAIWRSVDLAGDAARRVMAWGRRSVEERRRAPAVAVALD